jgi:hypothetical protein
MKTAIVWSCRHADRESGMSENILAAVDVTCQWLQATGIGDVDCSFKPFPLTLFDGTKTR